MNPGLPGPALAGLGSNGYPQLGLTDSSADLDRGKAHRELLSMRHIQRTDLRDSLNLFVKMKLC